MRTTLSFQWQKQDLHLEKHQEGSTARAILTRSSTTENIDFHKRDEAEAASKKSGITRFPTMPDNWGPKARAKDNRYGIVEHLYRFYGFLRTV